MLDCWSEQAIEKTWYVFFISSDILQTKQLSDNKEKWLVENENNLRLQSYYKAG